MKRTKWLVFIGGMGLVFFGCKKEQPAEAPPAEQPKAEAPAATPKSETPSPAAAQPEPTPTAPAAVTKQGYDRPLLLPPLLTHKPPTTFTVNLPTPHTAFPL